MFSFINPVNVSLGLNSHFFSLYFTYKLLFHADVPGCFILSPCVSLGCDTYSYARKPVILNTHTHNKQSLVTLLSPAYTSDCIWAIYSSKHTHTLGHEWSLCQQIYWRAWLSPITWTSSMHIVRSYSISLHFSPTSRSVYLTLLPVPLYSTHSLFPLRSSLSPPPHLSPETVPQWTTERRSNRKGIVKITAVREVHMHENR